MAKFEIRLTKKVASFQFVATVIAAIAKLQSLLRIRKKKITVRIMLFTRRGSFLDFFATYRRLWPFGSPHIQFDLEIDESRIPVIPLSFFKSVKTLQVDNYQQEDDIYEEEEDNQSTYFGFQNDGFRRMGTVMKALPNLEKLTIQGSYIQRSFRFLQAPLTYLDLEKIIISQRGFDALVKWVSDCKTLETLKIALDNNYRYKQPAKSAIFDAVLCHESITSFKLSTNPEKINETEYQALLTMISEPSTLRNLNIVNTHLPPRQACRLLQALAKNKSLTNAEVDIQNYGTWEISGTSENELFSNASAIKTSLIQLVEQNRTLRSLKIWYDEYINWQDAYYEQLTHSFVRNPVITYCGRQYGKMQLKMDIGQEKYERFDYDAANILMVGRVFLGAKRVCGYKISSEVIDCILQHYTAESPWYPENWQAIRRAVLDRGTIGKLLSEEYFSAEELVYLCSRIVLN